MVLEVNKLIFVNGIGWVTSQKVVWEKNKHDLSLGL